PRDHGSTATEVKRHRFERGAIVLPPALDAICIEAQRSQGLRGAPVGLVEAEVQPRHRKRVHRDDRATLTARLGDSNRTGVQRIEVYPTVDRTESPLQYPAP